MAGPPKPLRLFVFSHPRTASNLFCKIFSEHPSIDLEKYTFYYAYLGGTDAQARGMEQFQKTLNEMGHRPSYQTSLDNLETIIAKAEAKVGIRNYMTREDVIKDIIGGPRVVPPAPKMEDNMLDVPEDKRKQIMHIPYRDLGAPVINPTVLPDRFLKTLAPIFLIRHPAKQTGSTYRVLKSTLDDPSTADYDVLTSYRFSRLLFDYFRSYYLHEKDNSDGGKLAWPIVVDADDLLNDTEGLLRRFCALVEIDHDGVIYNWDEGKSKDHFLGSFMETLNGSLGVVKNKSPEKPDIAKESKKWEAEWGPELTQELLQYAENTLPDYEYLYQFRL